MSMTGQYLRLPMPRIMEVLEHPETLLGTLYPDDEANGADANHLDIDKTWGIIDYLVNLGSEDEDSPLGNIVMGGAELSEEDLGYGPARYLTQSEVSGLDAALRPLTAGVIWARYDPASAERDEIYWSAEEDSKAYFETNYNALLRFIQDAAQAGEGIILWLA